MIARYCNAWKDIMRAGDSQVHGVRAFGKTLMRALDSGAFAAVTTKRNLDFETTAVGASQ